MICKVCSSQEVGFKKIKFVIEVEDIDKKFKGEMSVCYECGTTEFAGEQLNNILGKMDKYFEKWIKEEV